MKYILRACGCLCCFGLFFSRADENVERSAETPQNLIAKPVANPLGLPLNEMTFQWTLPAAAGKQVAYLIRGRRSRKARGGLRQPVGQRLAAF